MNWLPPAILVALLLHLQLARTAAFYRYDAYLIVLTVVAACATVCMPRKDAADAGGFAERLRRPWTTALVLVVLALPLFARAQRGNGYALLAGINVYEQQCQTARFIAEELGPQPRVALNDLGAATYYADIRVLDLYGLGSIEFARARRTRSRTTALIEQELRAHDIEYVVVFASWFHGKSALPDWLVAVRRWTIPNNVTCGDDDVTFFATSPERADTLARALDRFEPKLPRGVRTERPPFVPEPPPCASPLPF